MKIREPWGGESPRVRPLGYVLTIGVKFYFRDRIVVFSMEFFCRLVRYRKRNEYVFQSSKVLKLVGDVVGVMGFFSPPKSKTATP